MDRIMNRIIQECVHCQAISQLPSVPVYPPASAITERRSAWNPVNGLFVIVDCTCGLS